jgi:hypothetical protein
MARRVCPRVEFGCRSRRTTPRFREARFPVATGRVDGDPSSVGSQGLQLSRVAGGKGVDNRYRGGKATAPGRSEPGVRKGIAGRRSSQDGRHPGLSLGSLVHAGGLEGDLSGSQGSGARASVTCLLGEATGVSEARCARIVTGRKRPRGEMSQKASLCSPPKRIALSCNRRSPLIALARERSTQGEPTMRGYWYEEVRWQKSVQRIARCDVR